ncbi:MAG TPA: FG-GAP-like repeat-containing protein [Gammaproteobacteria bacterium]|nr:FG-GAP-like repeat-containing protein [Gammaproteobacteria bacterium]
MHSRRSLPSVVLGLAALACCGAAGAKDLFPTQFVGTLNSPGSVVMADLNHDGAKDLVEIGADGTVAVLLNDGSGTFKPPAEYYVTSSNVGTTAFPDPRAVVAADVNGDGIPDLIVVNSAANSVSVLIGRGDGTFIAQTATQAVAGIGTPAPSYPVGQGATSAAVADLNGDGKPDIVTADFRDNTVSVLLNKGNGTFAARSTVLVGNGPDFVTIADLNKDGKPDVIVSDSSDDSFTVLLGKGDGNFTLEPEVRVGPSPGRPTLQMVVVEDFDNDGNPDLISTNTNPNSSIVMYYPGMGDGTFGAPHGILTGPDTLFLQATTLDASGNLGFIAGSTADGAIHVMFGKGNGGFASGAKYPAFGLSTSLASQAFAVGDVNGDGKPDVAVVNSTGSFVQILYNDGNGGFHQTNSYDLGSQPADMRASDLNGDGHDDVVEVNSADGTVGVLLGHGDGTFQAMQTYPVSGHPVRLALADVNGDGKLDVVTANNDGVNGTISVLLGNGDGTFQPALNLPAGANPMDVAVADMDHDGKMDIVVGNATVNTVSVLYGKGSATFSLPKSFPAGSQINALAVGDLTHDGFPDVVTVGGNVAVLRNDGQGGLVPIVLNKNGRSQDTYSAIGNRIVLKDVNADGDLDMVIADYSNSELTVLLGNRLGYFTRVPLVSPTCSNPNNLAASDINGDGHMDVVVSCAGSSSIGVMLGNGRGTFINGTYPAELNPRGVATADFNEDGNPDIAVINGDSDNMNVLLQIPGVVAHDNAPRVISAPFSVVGSVTAASGLFEAVDADGDGLTYIVVNQPAEGSLSYSTTTGTFSYLANPGYVGPDSMTFEVSDGVKLSGIGTVNIDVRSSGGSSSSKHGFLGGLGLPLLPLLGILTLLRRRR